MRPAVPTHLREWLAGPPAAATLCALGSLLALRALPLGLGDVDAVNFARALQRFDPLHQAPHLPGYPVYVLACRLLQALGGAEPTLALALPGLLLWPVAGAVLFAGLRARLGSWPAWAAVGLTAFSPAFVLSLGWPASDGLGLSLAALAVGAAYLPGARARSVAALMFGLLLGVRLSYWPIVLVAVAVGLLRAPPRERLAGSAAFAAGLAAWALPLLFWVEPRALLRLGLDFGAQHLDRVGAPAHLGALLVGLAERWTALLGLGLGATGVGAGALEPMAALLVTCALGLVCVVAAPERALRPLLAGGAAYAVWLWYGQNLNAARHVLPLLPVLGAAFGVVVLRLRAPRPAGPWLAAAALAAGALLGGRALVQAQAQGRVPPALALSRWVASHHAPAPLLVLAGEEARVFEHAAPAYRVILPADATVARREACRALGLGVPVWTSSAAPGAAELRGIALAEFPAIGSAGPSRRALSLFEVDRRRCDGVQPLAAWTGATPREERPR